MASSIAAPVHDLAAARSWVEASGSSVSDLGRGPTPKGLLLDVPPDSSCEGAGAVIMPCSAMKTRYQRVRVTLNHNCLEPFKAF